MKQKKIIISIVVIVLLLVVAAFVVPRIYAAKESSKIAAPTISAGATATSAVTSAERDLNGAWEITSGSYAGYRVDEVLNGANVTVVGRTEQVSGSVAVVNEQLTEAKIAVDLASVKTDSERRDNYFRTKAIDTTVNPQASFEVNTPVAISGLSATPMTVELAGSLTINGVTNPVSVNAQMAQTGDTVTVAGSIPVVWQDYQVAAPSLGFVQVEEAGQLEFQAVLKK